MSILHDVYTIIGKRHKLERQKKSRRWQVATAAATNKHPLNGSPTAFRPPPAVAPEKPVPVVSDNQSLRQWVFVVSGKEPNARIETHGGVVKAFDRQGRLFAVYLAANKKGFINGRQIK